MQIVLVTMKLIYAYKWAASSTDSTYVCLSYTSAGVASFNPKGNGAISLGSSTSNRWNVVYAANGNIQTSDIRVKDDIADVPEAILDVWGNIKWHTFKMKDAVEKKGDKARTHSGMIAQEIERAFEDSNIDPTRYGFFCFDKWDARPATQHTDENGEIVYDDDAVEAGELYSLRYDELLCIEAAYQRRRADRLEAKLSEAEEKLAELVDIKARLSKLEALL